MSVTKRHIKIGQVPVYDTNLIYSRVLGLQQSRDISLEDVIGYELSPIPTSLFQNNGELRITKSKSVMKNKLQVELSGRLQPKPQCIIIDGCALMWVIHWPANGKVIDYANNFTICIKKQMISSDVHLVFDRYHTPSIKDATRLARAGKDATRGHKLSMHTPLPSQKVTLSVSKNKIQLITIICQVLKEEALTLSQGHTLVVTNENPVPFQIRNGVITDREDLRTTHEEADVIIVQQAVKLAKGGASRIDVVCDDTDVFILLIHFYSQENLTSHILMMGTSSDRKVVDIGATAERHADISDKLLAAHALSGCDTVSQLFGLGKGIVIKKLKLNHALNNLGKANVDIARVIAESTSFIAACYGSPETSNMSAVRYSIWASKMANRKLSSAPELKTLPPTTEAFSEHVHRAHFQAAVWRCSLAPDPPPISAVDYGWCLDEQAMTLVPTTLPPYSPCAPENVLKLIRCGCSSDMPCATARCSCSAAQLSCSLFCSCHQLDNCCNIKTNAVHSLDDSDGNQSEDDTSFDS